MRVGESYDKKSSNESNRTVSEYGYQEDGVLEVAEVPLWGFLQSKE